MLREIEDCMALCGTTRVSVWALNYRGVLEFPILVGIADNAVQAWELMRGFEDCEEICIMPW